MNYKEIKMKTDKETTQLVEKLGLPKKQETSRDAQSTSSEAHWEERGTPEDTPATGGAKQASKGLKVHLADELAEKVRKVSIQRVRYSEAAKIKYADNNTGKHRPCATCDLRWSSIDCSWTRKWSRNTENYCLGKFEQDFRNDSRVCEIYSEIAHDRAERPSL